MITPEYRFDKHMVEWYFKLPLNARDLEDADFQVNQAIGDGNAYDDRYTVRSDDGFLIFSWEV